MIDPVLFIGVLPLQRIVSSCFYFHHNQRRILSLILLPKFIVCICRVFLFELFHWGSLFYRGLGIDIVDLDVGRVVSGGGHLFGWFAQGRFGNRGTVSPGFYWAAGYRRSGFHGGAVALGDLLFAGCSLGFNEASFKHKGLIIKLNCYFTNIIGYILLGGVKEGIVDT